MAGRRDTRSAMDIDSHVALIGQERRPRVQTDPHENRAGYECFGQLGGGGERGRRCRKCDEERIALGIDLYAIVSGTRPTDDPPVCGKRSRIHARSQLVQELRRPLDIREEESDCAGRKLPMHEP
jgi:hypothetical protein